MIIARGKKPVAKLVPIGRTKKKRVPGRYKDLIKIHPSFYDPLAEDELKEWEHKAVKLERRLRRSRL